METLNPSVIDSWHAHVYFDASSRDAARALREVIEKELAGRMDLGRFHERPVGPHPMWSYQLAIAAVELSVRRELAGAEPRRPGRVHPSEHR